MFGIVDTGSVFWSRSPVQVHYYIYDLCVKFDEKRSWFYVIRMLGCENRSFKVFLKISFDLVFDS